MLNRDQTKLFQKVMDNLRITDAQISAFGLDILTTSPKINGDDIVAAVKCIAEARKHLEKFAKTNKVPDITF